MPTVLPETTTAHISVCICTYKRPDLLKRLLTDLDLQETNGLFSYSVVVVDNDSSRSAEAVVTEFAARSERKTGVVYCVESRQNIALARNKAIENATGDLVAFIDDDEFPTRTWLLTLFTTLNEYNVAGVLGPVKPHFDVEPPQWVVKSKLYDRATYPTGFVIDWRKGRTGNVLLRRSILPSDGNPLFRPEFRTGEDQDFFRRMIGNGHKFVWCNESLAYETVPPIRWKRSFILKRALLQGAIARRHPNFGAVQALKSLVAVPVYSAVLPLMLVCSHAMFMQCLVRWCDHAGRLMALAGLDPIKQAYVTE